MWLDLLSFILIGAASPTAPVLQPILEYRFNETGTDAANTGASVTDPVVMRMFDAAGALADRHSAGGRGVSGLPGDRAFDNTAGASMGDGRTGGQVCSVPMGIFEIHGLLSFTLSGWLQTEGTTPPGDLATLLTYYDNGQGFKLVFPQAGRLRLVVDGGEVDSPANAYASTQQWVFFAVSYDGTRSADNVNFHVGSPEAAVSRVGEAVTLDQGQVDTSSFLLSENYGRLTLGSAFDGYLDNLRVFGSKADASGVLNLAQLETLRQTDVKEGAGSPSKERAEAVLPAPPQVIRQEEGPWQDSPRPWSSLPVEVREELQPGRPRFSEQIPDSPFGAQLSTMDDRVDRDRIPFVLDQFAATGLKWLRDGAVTGLAPGESMEQARERWKRIPDYYFTFCQEARSRGIHLLVTLRVIMPGGGKVSGSGERGRQALAEWCRIIVPALKPWVQDWEIDNEPNPEIPPPEYVAAVRTAYQVIKEIDPAARVYGGVVANLECLAPATKGGKDPYPDPNSCYIDGLLEAGLLEVCDVFSFHPYRPPLTRPVPENIPEHGSQVPPWDQWPDYVAQINDLKARLRQAAGRDFPIAATEWGYPTHFDAETGEQFYSLEAAAKYELRASIMDHFLGVNPTINFAFKRQIYGPYDLEAHVGMVRPNWIRQPKYYAYTGLCSLLDGRDQPVDWPVRVTAPESNATGPVCFYAFYRPQTLHLTLWETVRGGFFIAKERRFQPMEMVTLAFWRAVPAAEDGAVVPLNVELTLPDGEYGYPLLLDPRNLFARPYIPLGYRQRGNVYLLTGLPAGDSPLMVRFFKVVKGGDGNGR